MKTLIRVGHSAYKGTNALRMCFSKAQAVRVLCNRGVKRNTARKAVTKAITQQGATAYGESSEAIEICDYSRLSTMDYAYTKKSWSAVSEL